MYDRTGLSTKCTLIKPGLKKLCTGMKAKVRPFVDALLGPMNRESPGYLGAYEAKITCIFANLRDIQGL